MAETPDQINESIFRIMKLSPTATHSVEEQKYNMSFQVEEVDEEAIRQEAFVGLIEDMASIGLYFDCPNEEIYANNAVDLDAALLVLEFLMPNTLYVKMRQFPRLVDGIKGVLRGISDDPVVFDYLHFLGGLNGTTGLFPALGDSCAFLSTRIRCEELFVNYLENLVQLIEEERVIAVSPPTDPNGWARFKDTVEMRVADGIRYLEEKLTDKDLVAKLFMRLQVAWIQPMASPTTQARLCFLYLTNPATLASTMQKFYAKVLKEWQVTSKVFPLYFTTRDEPMSPLDAMGFCLYAFSTTDTPAQFERALAVLAAKAPAVAQIIKVTGDHLMALKEERVAK